MYLPAMPIHSKSCPQALRLHSNLVRQKPRPAWPRSPNMWPWPEKRASRQRIQLRNATRLNVAPARRRGRGLAPGARAKNDPMTGALKDAKERPERMSTAKREDGIEVQNGVRIGRDSEVGLKAQCSEPGIRHQDSSNLVHRARDRLAPRSDCKLMKYGWMPSSSTSALEVQSFGNTCPT